MGSERAVLTEVIIHRLAELRRKGEIEQFDAFVRELKRRNKHEDVDRVVQFAERLAELPCDSKET